MSDPSTSVMRLVIPVATSIYHFFFQSAGYLGKHKSKYYLISDNSTLADQLPDLGPTRVDALSS